MEIDSVIIRRSPVILLYKMILVTLILSAALTVYSLVLYQNVRGVELFVDKFSFYGLTVGLEALVMILLFLQWSFTTYEIKSTELICCKGVLWRKRDMHTLKSMQAVYTKQGFFGTMLNYGTVTMHSPLSKEEVSMKNVPDPEKYARALRNALDESENQEHIVPIQS